MEKDLAEEYNEGRRVNNLESRFGYFVQPDECKGVWIVLIVQVLVVAEISVPVWVLGSSNSVICASREYWEYWQSYLYQSEYWGALTVLFDF